MTATETETTATPICGAQYTTPTGREKVCTKEVDANGNHEGNHSDRVPNKAKEYKPVALSVLETYEAVPGEETVAYGAGKRETERSAEQVLVDKQVKDAYESWVAAGKPKAFNDMPRKRYQLRPGDVESVRFMLRKAARHHGIAVRIAPPKKHVRGFQMIYWAACDQNKRETDNG